MDKTQALMDQAYARFKANRQWSKQDFWDQLDAQERIAVFAGNLNYQVENGGFMQWFDNGYATDEVTGFLIRLCQRIGSPTSDKVEMILRDFLDHTRGRNSRDDDADDWDSLFELLEPLNTRYYEINNQFMSDVETYLGKD